MRVFVLYNQQKSITDQKMHPKKGCCCSLCCDHVSGHNIDCVRLRARTRRATHLDRLLSNELQ
jgi:hypothetical protein